MTWKRTATVGDAPPDPLGDALAAALADIGIGTDVELVYAPTGAGDWRIRVEFHANERVAPLLAAGDGSALGELLDVLAEAGPRVLDAFRRFDTGRDGPLGPQLGRALRDALACEVLSRYLARRTGAEAPALIAETIDYLLELGGTRVESHDLTHGVLIADVFTDTPRLSFAYPDDIRAAKRASLLFDGQHALLVVDTAGRARTELQRHRLERFGKVAKQDGPPGAELLESGSLVATATRVFGGLGLFLRGDRSIWTFVDGSPLLVRRGEHWSAFPLELSAAIASMVGNRDLAELVANVAFMISGRPSGAILAVVDDADALDGIVSPKDRYDLRNDVSPDAMQIETRLHHLIDAQELDEQTLVRLAMLDGATILDRAGNLLAYGAIVSSGGSQFEGARTAASRSLSKRAEVVLNVSVDGDITIFRHGMPLTTLLGRGMP